MDANCWLYPSSEAPCTSACSGHFADPAQPPLALWAHRPCQPRAVQQGPQCAGKWDNIKANSTRKMKEGPVLCPVAHIALGSSAGLGPNLCNSSQSTPVPSRCSRTQLMGLHPLGLVTGHIPLANPGIALQRKPWKGQFNSIKFFSSPGWIK